MPTESNPSTVQTVASTIPVVGNIVGVITGFFSSLVKQGTTHPSWRQANDFASTFDPKVEKAIVDAYGTDTAIQIGIAYAKRMKSFLQTVDRWDKNDATRASAINNMDTLIAKVGMLKAGIIQGVTWDWVMWSMQNSDAARPDDFSTVMYNDLNTTLGNAIKDVTGKYIAVIPVVGATAVSTTGVSSGPASSTASIFSAFPNLSTSSTAKYILAVAVVVVIIFLMRRK